MLRQNMELVYYTFVAIKYPTVYWEKKLNVSLFCNKSKEKIAPV